MALIDRFLDRMVQRGELTVIFPNGRQRTFGTPDPELGSVTIRMKDRKVFTQILADPALGAAESYMDGRLEVEQGDIRDLIVLARANDAWEDKRSTLGASMPRRVMNAIAHKVQSRNAAKTSKQNVAHHYDLSERLYDLFLDADRQYSCAYWTDPENETLEQAQLDKKAHIAAKLYLKPGMKVLDIGCGWGGMALYLHEKYGVEVLGVTLSEEQIKIAKARAEAAGVADKVKFQLIDYRDIDGKFDRIVSVGMFEHVGTPQYPVFFKKCRELLTDEGVMLIHTIGRMGPPGVTDTFTLKYIFPGGYIPALSEMIAPNEPNHMFVTDVEVLRLHYGYTLKSWYDRTVAAKEQIIELYDERFYRMWLYYLAGAETAFSYDEMVNFQVQYARNRHTLPITRDYMIAEEARLTGSADRQQAAE
ncbi:SAM-dependent methyltransferase [Stakelama pacifica]|uniref:Cyclopropane-fatty-acyl-phospholipid synthase n=1 Tax=Stakelama pacifica TaxID=517720 RepID=A0A4R6FUD6_9SPHN|nr:cyclopropane-fatty-acyl-phospholipid synthase family protein [Stakelama pacifica]TDN85476.1 cyclopropane-fatty-acyl-phospholipid synthase [Stakelama pacifica]GGO92540.1 cyclopropane-fatty-acyl-phospholipid synthase [Stakelama pacifica]